MTDYKKLVEALRMGADYGVEDESVSKLCSDAADAIERLQEMLKAVQENSGINFRMWKEAQAEIEHLKKRNEELSKNWKYCSDLLNIALKYGCKSMTELLKLYDMEGAER